MHLVGCLCLAILPLPSGPYLAAICENRALVLHENHEGIKIRKSQTKTIDIARDGRLLLLAKMIRLDFLGQVT